MTHTPTPEQQAIVAAAQNTTSNLIISALAGAAKTSTLVLIAEALPKTRMLCLAFNKRIAEEMKARLPANCTPMTLNALGHRTWKDYTGKWPKLDTGKNYGILSALVKELPKSDQEEARETFADLLKYIAQGKTAGYIPTDLFPKARGIMGDEDFFSSIDEEPSPLMMQLIREVSRISIEQGLEGTIDFDDQILLPTVFPAMFDFFPLVMVDEAQDLSPLNHRTLLKLARRRIIAVGDECQSIYAFRGADTSSMRNLQETFKMEKLILSVSFRCPRKVVEAARWRASHMQYPDWAIEGKVTVLDKWDKTTVPETAAIICRNNAPLFSMAIKLLKNGRRPEIIGNDIGKYLLKVLSKFGPKSMPIGQVFDKIREWGEEKKRKARNKGKIEDQMACLRIFAEQGQNLGDAMAYADHIFSQQGPIQLMTGHKSKGLEFDTVFFLDPGLLRIDEQQDKNLKYVIQTRAKRELYYVRSEDFFDEFEHKRLEAEAVEG